MFNHLKTGLIASFSLASACSTMLIGPSASAQSSAPAPAGMVAAHANCRVGGACIDRRYRISSTPIFAVNGVNDAGAPCVTWIASLPNMVYELNADLSLGNIDNAPSHIISIYSDGVQEYFDAVKNERDHWVPATFIGNTGVRTEMRNGCLQAVEMPSSRTDYENNSSTPILRANVNFRRDARVALRFLETDEGSLAETSRYVYDPLEGYLPEDPNSIYPATRIGEPRIEQIAPTSFQTTNRRSNLRRRYRASAGANNVVSFERASVCESVRDGLIEDEGQVCNTGVVFTD